MAGHVCDPDDDFAFKVWNPKTGQEFKVYPDGRISGFETPFVVINRIPQLIEQARIDAYANADCEPR